MEVHGELMSGQAKVLSKLLPGASEFPHTITGQIATEEGYAGVRPAGIREGDVVAVII